jgi:hypothetical protein
MAALLDKPIPEKQSHCLERIDGNDCIIDNDGSFMGLGIIKPKIKIRETLGHEEVGSEESKESYQKKKLRCMKYIPAHKKCILIFENG